MEPVSISAAVAAAAAEVGAIIEKLLEVASAISKIATAEQLMMSRKNNQKK